MSGYRLGGKKNELEEIKNSSFSTTDTMAIDAILGQAYDVTYGIFDHDNNAQRPLASVAVHPAEDLDTGSQYRSRVKEFINKRVYEKTGLDLSSFLRLTRYEVETIFEECDIVEERRFKDLEEQLRNPKNTK